MKKILAFIKNKDNKLLLLKGNSTDPQFHKSFWYTVTGGVENIDKTYIDTVKREVKEETNLEVDNVVYLNWVLKYASLGNECEEYVFICEDNGKMDVCLNEESIDYKWCELDLYVEKIKWYSDKCVLKELLKQALHNNQYFNEEQIINL